MSSGPSPSLTLEQAREARLSGRLAQDAIRMGLLDLPIGTLVRVQAGDLGRVRVTTDVEIRVGTAEPIRRRVVFFVDPATSLATVQGLAIQGGEEIIRDERQWYAENMRGARVTDVAVFRLFGV